MGFQYEHVSRNRLFLKSVTRSKLCECLRSVMKDLVHHLCPFWVTRGFVGGRNLFQIVHYGHKYAFEFRGECIERNLLIVQRTLDVVAKNGGGVDNLVHSRRNLGEMGRVEVRGSGIKQIRNTVLQFLSRCLHYVPKVEGLRCQLEFHERLRCTCHAKNWGEVCICGIEMRTENRPGLVSTLTLYALENVSRAQERRT